MKNILIFVLCLVWVSAFGAGEPVQRQAFTTNTLPATIDTGGSTIHNTLIDSTVTGNGSGLTSLTAGNLTGTVSIANGGTASSANQAAGKQVGVFALGNNIPVDTGNYVGQLGVSPNGFLYWWNGTSFASNSFSFLTSPNVFGDPNLAGPNGPVQVNWFLAGDKSQQNSTNNTSDEVVRFMGCDPWGTGGGNGYVIATTNAAGNGTAIGTNANGVPWYWKQADINAYSLIAVGEQATNNDAPGFLILIADSIAFPFAWCLNTSISNRQGDFPFAWFDTTNGIEKHPQWIGTNNFPIGTSLENETWQINNKLNTVTMGTNTQLFGANGGTTLTGVNGTFNLAAFDAAQGGTLNVGNATVQATNFIANQLKGTTAAISINGLGLIGVTASAAQEGNELWIGDSSGQVATMSGSGNWNRFLIRNVDLGWKTDGGGDIGAKSGTLGGSHFAARPANVWVKTLVASQHFGGQGTAPTIVTNAGAGSSTATVTLDANASDAAMTITLATGTLPTGSATVFTCTYNAAYATKPHVVAYPGNNNAAALNGVTMVFDDSANDTTNAFTFKSGGTGLAAGTTYIWNVVVVQ